MQVIFKNKQDAKAYLLDLGIRIMQGYKEAEQQRNALVDICSSRWYSTVNNSLLGRLFSLQSDDPWQEPSQRYAAALVYKTTTQAESNTLASYQYLMDTYSSASINLENQFKRLDEIQDDLVSGYILDV